MMRTTIHCLLLGAPLMVACAHDGRPAPVQPAPSATPQISQRGLKGAMPHMARPDTADRDAATDPAIGFIDPGAERPERIRNAIAVLHPTSGSDVTGTVQFVDPGGGIGVEVIARVDGLPEGAHAYHVHVYGDCSAPDGKSAGPHFHFLGSSFDKGVGIVTGNLGDLRPSNGRPTEERALIAGAKLHGPFSIIGRAVVVHAKPNDPRVTPDGGAGERIACGVIGVAEASEDEGRPTTASRG